MSIKQISLKNEIIMGWFILHEFAFNRKPRVRYPHVIGKFKFTDGNFTEYDIPFTTKKEAEAHVKYLKKLNDKSFEYVNKYTVVPSNIKVGEL